MQGFTIIDGVVAAIIVISALLAYSRGFMRELMAIAAWVAAAIMAFLFSAQVQPLIEQVPILGDFISGSCELTIIAAFAAVFAVTLIVFSIFTPLFSAAIQRTILGGVDQGLGFLFGVARGVLLVSVAFFLYQTILSSQSIEMVDSSRSAAVFSRMTDSIKSQDPEAALGWITNRYGELVNQCTGANA